MTTVVKTPLQEWITVDDFLPREMAESVHKDLISANWNLQFCDMSGKMCFLPADVHHANDISSYLPIVRENVDIERLFFVLWKLRSRDQENSYHDGIQHLFHTGWKERIREIVQDDRVNDINCIPSLYSPQCFLGKHVDENLEAGSYKRIFAYSLNLSKDWSPDWGGGLTLESSEGLRIVPPRFNSITIFSVRMVHWVPTISLAAKGFRVGLVGWLMQG